MDDKRQNLIERIKLIKWDDAIDELIETLDDIEEFYQSRDDFKLSDSNRIISEPVQVVINKQGSKD